MANLYKSFTERYLGGRQHNFIRNASPLNEPNEQTFYEQSLQDSTMGEDILNQLRRNIFDSIRQVDVVPERNPYSWHTGESRHSRQSSSRLFTHAPSMSELDFEIPNTYFPTQIELGNRPTSWSSYFDDTQSVDFVRPLWFDDDSEFVSDSPVRFSRHQYMETDYDGFRTPMHREEVDELRGPNLYSDFSSGESQHLMAGFHTRKRVLENKLYLLPKGTRIIIEDSQRKAVVSVCSPNGMLISYMHMRNPLVFPYFELIGSEDSRMSKIVSGLVQDPYDIEEYGTTVSFLFKEALPFNFNDSRKSLMKLPKSEPHLPEI